MEPPWLDPEVEKVARKALGPLAARNRRVSCRKSRLRRARMAIPAPVNCVGNLHRDPGDSSVRIFVIASLMLLAVPAAAAPGDLSGPAAAHAVDALIASMNGYVDPQTGASVQALLRKERSACRRSGDREALVGSQPAASPTRTTSI